MAGLAEGVTVKGVYRMSRKKMRKIWCWRKERSRKRAGGKHLRPAAPLAFRARRNKRENSESIIAEALENVRNSYY